MKVQTLDIILMDLLVPVWVGSNVLFCVSGYSLLM